MKLQRRLSRAYKGKKYYKYILVIPEKEIKKAEFDEGDFLKIDSVKGEIKINKEVIWLEKKKEKKRLKKA